jgi:hypothetical protein
MVYVMSKVKYPPHVADDILKFYLSGKAPKYPDFVKRSHQWVTPDYKIKIYNIYEIPEDKLYEGMKGIAKRLNAFTKFEGYVYKVMNLMEGSEAIKLYQE